MKIFTPLIIYCFLVTTSHAQLIRSYGIKTGFTATQQKWEYSSGFLNGFKMDSKLGINVGIYLEFFDIPYLGVVAEFNYVQKGVQKDIPFTTAEYPYGTGEMVNWIIRIDYLNLSILGKGRLNLGLIQPYIIAGPKMDVEINKSISPGKDSSFNEWNEILTGAKYGMGVELNIFSKAFIVELVKDTNFKDIYHGDNATVKSESYEFNIGLGF